MITIDIEKVVGYVGRLGGDPSEVALALRSGDVKVLGAWTETMLVADDVTGEELAAVQRLHRIVLAAKRGGRISLSAFLRVYPLKQE
jgi:hypothetical protein